MPHTRMDAALATAQAHQATTNQFTLSQADWLAFKAMPHPRKSTVSAHPNAFAYRGVAVIEADQEDAISLLHILNTATLKGPIKV